MPRTIVIQPPVGGVVRSVAFQSQPPFSSYKSVNFWPKYESGRVATSTRPPLKAADFTSNENLDPINMLTPISGSATISGQAQPAQAFVVARSSDGQLFVYDNNNSFTVVGGSQASNIDTNRIVFAQPLLHKTYIMQATTVPIVHDWSANTAELLVASAGSIPTDCRMAAAWQGALWIAGQLANRHIVYGSAASDPTDWDFAVGIEDEGGAFAFTGDDEGLMRGPVTALIAHTADTMIVSTVEGLSMLRGHPRAGGVLEHSSSRAYVLGQGAWAKTPGDRLVFMSQFGLMELGPEAGAVPTLLSKNKIPDELVGLAYDIDDPDIMLEYDSRWNVIHIIAPGEPAAWIYDLDGGGFHQMTFANYPDLLLEFLPVVSASDSGVLYGGQILNEGLAHLSKDGTETFTSELIIGPFRLSNGANTQAILQRLRLVFGAANETLAGTLTVAAGPDGVNVINLLDNASNTAQYSVALADIVDNNFGVCHPRVTGHSAGIKIELNSGQETIIEEIVLTVEDMGMNRLARRGTVNPTSPLA